MRYRWSLLAVLVASVGCRLPREAHIPPAAQLMHPGPGVDGPGPGVMMWGDCEAQPSTTASQIAFGSPDGMIVNWDVGAPGQFDSEPLVAPGRYNFPQGAIYRLKLTNVPGRPGLELYPTLEVAPALPRTDAYLAHNAIPVQFTEEDFDQVQTGNFVTKVIYLPDAEYQDLAIAGVETLVSTRLDPGVDPIIEADRRGAILAIIRVGNKDLQVPEEGLVEGEGMMPAAAMQGISSPPNVAGLTAPEFGMPITGTPIGLPGPPHIPLGMPAGLQRHTIVNRTHYNIPNPTKNFRISVKQRPGFRYPKPVNSMHITESTMTPGQVLRQPECDRHVQVP